MFFFYLAEEITTSFNQYGDLIVDWPHKAESKSYFPPKGYAFLLFQVSWCFREAANCNRLPLPHSIHMYLSVNYR